MLIQTQLRFRRTPHWSGWSDFHMIDNLSAAFHTFPMFMLTSLSVDKILVSRTLQSLSSSRSFKKSISSVGTLNADSGKSQIRLMTGTDGKRKSLPSAWLDDIYIYKQSNSSYVVIWKHWLKVFFHYYFISFLTFHYQIIFSMKAVSFYRFGFDFFV